MGWTTISAIILVGFLNIAFNVWTRKAAAESDSWLEGILSFPFAVAFTIGTASLLTLFTLYSTKIQLGRAILLMGAVSIIGGTLYGTFVGRQPLTATESGLVVAIGALFLYRVFF